MAIPGDLYYEGKQVEVYGRCPMNGGGSTCYCVAQCKGWENVERE